MAFVGNLSLQEWTDPVCTLDGTIYELTSIMKWLKRYKVDPVSGEPLRAGDLVALHVHKNAQGKFHCPITFKEFTDYTKIVAVRVSGHVYAWEAVQRLNIDAKNWKDLVTGDPFTRKDLIILQDPTDPNKGNVQMFYHVKQGLSTDAKGAAKKGKFDESDDEEEKKKAADPLKNMTLSHTAATVIKELRHRAVRLASTAVSSSCLTMQADPPVILIGD